MREIKFRAWDIKKQLWITGESHHWLGLDLENGALFFVHHSGQVEIEEFYPTESLVLMQYAGLKDRHDKEIYEGDIIKRHHKTENLDEWGVVVYDAPTFSLEPRWPDNALGYIEWPSEYFDSTFNSCEVIGNIYENPELLEQEKRDSPK